MAVSVTFDGTAATGVTVVSDTEITCTTPADTAGAVDVVVTTDGGSDTLTSGYTYVDEPTATAIDPDSGSSAGGDTVTITGTGFVDGDTITVTFDGTAATDVSVTSATTITCTTPAGTAGAVDVVVTTSGGSVTMSGGYTYVDIPAPTVTAISPAYGSTAGGDSVTITGTGFKEGAS